RTGTLDSRRASGSKGRYPNAVWPWLEHCPNAIAAFRFMVSLVTGQVSHTLVQLDDHQYVRQLSEKSAGRIGDHGRGRIHRAQATAGLEGQIGCAAGRAAWLRVTRPNSAYGAALQQKDASVEAVPEGLAPPRPYWCRNARHGISLPRMLTCASI